METPELFQTCCYNAAQFAPESAKNGDNFVIEELLDFPNDDSMAEGDGGLEAALTAGTSTDSSTGTTVNDASSFCGGGGTVEQHVSPADVGGGRGFAGGQFASELCVPYDDLAELEWLSNFEEESFSSEDLQKLQLIQGVKARTNEANSHFQQYPFQPEITQPGPITNVPAKARSKRSRVAPGNWTSRLLAVSPTPPPPATVIPAVSSESESVVAAAKKAAKQVSHKKKEGAGNAGGEGRRCLHCATDKTPQWRTGPMGPKTLCNACGVRYKSGRLVPEYRPAASPTFVLTKHSNSHRKVLELRRQKEMMRAQQQQQEQQYMHHSSNHLRSVMFDQAPSNGEDYLIHQHIGPDFGQMMI